MNIQVVSDLHIDHFNDDFQNILDYLNPSADILILAGDIGSLYKFEQFSQFIMDIAKLFVHILYITGNHEYYKIYGYDSETISELNNKLYTLENKIPNFHFLNRRSVKINDVCIIGCTLWSHIDFELPKYMVRIYGMNKDIYNNFNSKDINYITRMIKYCQINNLKLVVVTHHCPTYTVQRQPSELSDLYYNNLDHLLTKEQVHTWIFGHTHTQCNELTAGGTILIANQKGKPKENITDYSKTFTIII